jgi:NAD(P)-dependent dehydrogenase (short-subunit alcohol dehydrogenase family)
MAKIFITGSSDGLGLFTAQKLVESGHEVILHARNNKRAEQTAAKFQKKMKILTADLSDLEEVKNLAKKVNSLGNFDVIIHNAGVYNEEKEKIFKINNLAVYILTALINKPKRLIYIGSNMHPQGDTNIEKLSLEKGVDYSTSKLQILMLSLALARLCPKIYTNTVDPGWVKTKMANYNAPDSLEDGSQTQIWLASDDTLTFNGKYFYHLKESDYSSKAKDIEMQNKLLKIYEKITGIPLPK